MCDVIGNKTKQIYLAHISKEANTKQKAIDTFYDVAKEKEICVSDIFVNAADQNIELIGGCYEKTVINS